MPAAVVTLCSALMTQLDPRWFGADGLTAVAVPTRVPPHANSLPDQLLHWGWAQAQFTNPILSGIVQGRSVQVAFHVAENPYDPNLLTLPIEFNCSLVVFLFLTAFTRIANKARMAAAVATALYLQWIFVFWTVFLFLSGMFLSDLNFEIDAWQSRSVSVYKPGDPTILPVWTEVIWKPVSRFTNGDVRFCLLRRALGFATLIFALWLLSTPEISLGARETWGYATITSLVPDRFGDDFLVPLGAVILVFTVNHARFLQGLFTNPLAQYLGRRVSFSLYLIHGPLLWSLGLKFGHFALGFTGEDSDWEYVLGILSAACLWWAVSIYLADLTTTHIDDNCVRFFKWPYARLAKKEIRR